VVAVFLLAASQRTPWARSNEGMQLTRRAKVGPRVRSHGRAIFFVGRLAADPQWFGGLPDRELRETCVTPRLR